MLRTERGVGSWMTHEWALYADWLTSALARLLARFLAHKEASSH